MAIDGILIFMLENRGTRQKVIEKGYETAVSALLCHKVVKNWDITLRELNRETMIQQVLFYDFPEHRGCYFNFSSAYHIKEPCKEVK